MTNLRLRTLGGLVLLRDGVELREMTSQRKALALLAVLAAANPRTVPRERLLLLFWPESDSERARGALKQMLHSLRRQLGSASVIDGVAELRLESSYVASDIVAFRDAMAAGDDESAIREWTGPFLDGVSVDGSAEFDRWADDERSRLNRQMGEALERLATHSAQAGLPADAVRWWIARHELEPLHSPSSLHLMRALESAGDRSGALRHAQAHEQLMRRELDMPADAAVVRYAEQLRNQREGAPIVVPAPRELPVASVATASNSPATVRVPASDALASLPAVAVMKPPRTRWRTITAITVFALLAFLFVPTLRILRARSGGRAVSANALVANRVAVSVFINRTGSREYDALGTMASDWVTRGVARTSGVELFDIGGLYLEGRAPSGTPTDPRTLARSNGAGVVVVGNYYLVNGRITFSVQLLDVETGRVLQALEPVAGDVRAPLATVEEVRQRVASALGMQFDPRASQATPTALVPPRYDAYAEYAAAQEIYWRGDWEGALPHFRAAATLDTSFYSALAYVGVAGVGTGRCYLADSVSEVFARKRANVPEFDWLTSQISVARCASDHEAHNRLQRERAALLPGSRLIAMTMSTGFRQLNRPGEAMAILSGVNPARDLGWLPQRGRGMYWREIASNQHLLKDYRAERATAERMQLAGVSPLAVGLVRGRSLAALGFADSALAALEAIANAPNDPSLVSGLAGRLDAVQLATPGWVMYQVALEVAAHGDSVRARVAMQRAIDWFGTFERIAPLKTGAVLVLARSLEYLGHYAEAQHRLIALPLPDRLSIDIRGTLAMIAAQSHDQSATTELVRWLTDIPAAFPLGLPLLYRAQVAAIRGDTTSALELLRALPHGAHPLDVMQFHVDPVLVSLRQSQTMQRWLVPRG